MLKHMARKLRKPGHGSLICLTISNGKSPAQCCGYMAVVSSGLNDTVQTTDVQIKVAAVRQFSRQFVVHL